MVVVVWSSDGSSWPLKLKKRKNSNNNNNKNNIRACNNDEGFDFEK